MRVAHHEAHRPDVVSAARDRRRGAGAGTFAAGAAYSTRASAGRSVGADPRTRMSARRRTESAGGAQVGLTDFRLDRDNQSLGYSPGSQFQTSEDRRVVQTPGLTVRVPLQ